MNMNMFGILPILFAVKFPHKTEKSLYLNQSNNLLFFSTCMALDFKGIKILNP